MLSPRHVREERGFKDDREGSGAFGTHLLTVGGARWHEDDAGAAGGLRASADFFFEAAPQDEGQIAEFVFVGRDVSTGGVARFGCANVPKVRRAERCSQDVCRAALHGATWRPTSLTLSALSRERRSAGTIAGVRALRS